MKKIFILALMAMLVGFAYAQETISGKDLQERYIQTYEELGYYIRQMSDAGNKTEIRQKYMSQALNLFYCKGEPYIEDDITKSAPKVIFERNGKKSIKTVKSFFCGLVRGLYDGNRFIIADIPIPHFPVDIDTNSLQQVSDSIFTLETNMSQRFLGYKDGQIMYTDATTKKTTVYLLMKNVNSKNIYTPKLTEDLYMMEKKTM